MSENVHNPANSSFSLLVDLCNDLNRRIEGGLNCIGHCMALMRCNDLDGLPFYSFEFGTRREELRTFITRSARKSGLVLSGDYEVEDILPAIKVHVDNLSKQKEQIRPLVDEWSKDASDVYNQLMIATRHLQDDG